MDDNHLVEFAEEEEGLTMTMTMTMRQMNDAVNLTKKLSSCEWVVYRKEEGVVSE